MLDILLLNPPSRSDSHYRPPFSLLYVAGYYISKGMSVRIADYPLAEQIRNAKFWRDRDAMLSECKAKMLNEVALYQPKSVGISCYSTELDEVKELIKDIREISDAKIIVGGIAPTLKPEDFKGIADEIVQGRQDANCACYDLVDMAHYSTPNIYAIRGVLLKCGQVLSGFGCPNSCLTGDTIIQTIKGKKKIKSLVGKEIKVLTRNPTTKDVEFAKAINIRLVEKNAKIIRVNFTDNTYIDCTPDHRFIVFENGNQHKETDEYEVEAKDLIPKQSVRAIREESYKKKGITITWGRRKRRQLHSLIMESELNRKLNKNEIIHHKDKNPKNNLLSNLILTSPSEHINKYHHDDISDRMKNNNPAKNLPKSFFIRLGKMQKGKKRSLQSRIRYRQSKLGSKNPNFKNGNSFGKSRIKEINHKVRNIEYLNYKKNVYCMEVPGYDWFYANNVLVHNCTFCVASTLREYFKGNVKTPQSLVDEILDLKQKYKINAFYIIDDLFTLNKNKVKEFCSLIEKHNLSWGCNSRVNTLDEETIKAMAKAHCIQLDFGVERGSDRALQELKKGITIEQIKATFRLCHKYHIRSFANFLVNIPGETPQDWYDIEKLIKEIKPTITCINVYQYYEGCKLGKETPPSDALMAWKRKVMIKSNWRSGFRWSAIKYSRVESFKDLYLLIKEGINQICSR
jgi:intein/homing endonuclease